MALLQSPFLTNFASGYVEILLSLTILIMLIIGSFKGDRSTRFLGYLALVVLGSAILITGYIEHKTEFIFQGLLVRNGFTGFCKIMVLSTVFVIFILTLRSLERENMSRFEYPILVLLCTLGMLVMVSSNDIIAMYLGLELQSLALYILVAFKREAPLAQEASVKYFILGSLASAFILYGSSFLYGLTGTTEWDSLFIFIQTHHLTSSYFLSFGLILVLAGLVFKLALVPFHVWAPDVYEGSPTPVTVLIAGAPKIAMFALLMRLWSLAPASLLPSAEIVWVVLISLSLTVGSFGALFQSNIKRLLGYSAISHMSYALMGLLGRTPQGYENVLVYLLVYVITTLGIFAVLLTLRKNGKAVETIEDFSQLSQSSPLMAGVMTIFLFSLAGIPPLGGFFAKLGVFSTALHQGYYYLVVYGVLMSVVSAGYYLKIIKTMYFDRSLTETFKFSFEIGSLREVSAVAGGGAVLVLIYGFIHTMFIHQIRDAVATLFS